MFLESISFILNNMTHILLIDIYSISGTNKNLIELLNN